MGMSYAARRNRLTVKTFDTVAQNYKRSFNPSSCDDESVEPCIPRPSDSREEIYLMLLKENSALNMKDVFQGAPEFFKQKIGLLDSRMRKDVADQVLDSKMSQPSFRQRTCSGCASLANFGNEKPKPVRGRHRSSLQLSGNASGGKVHEHSKESSTLRAGASNPNFTRESTGNRPAWKSVWNKSSSPSLEKLAPPHTTKVSANPIRLERPVVRPGLRRIEKPELDKLEFSDSDSLDFPSGEKTGVFERSSFKKLQPPKTIPSHLPEARDVFAVNGNVVSFKGFGTENFTNWFGNVENSCRQNVIRELDFSGFTNREISMKVLKGHKLMIEAVQTRPPNRKLTHSFHLPLGVEVESLFLTRNKHGHLFVEMKDDENY